MQLISALECGIKITSETTLLQDLVHAGTTQILAQYNSMSFVEQNQCLGELIYLFSICPGSLIFKT
jgi:hypothetical protein